MKTRATRIFIGSGLLIGSLIGVWAVTALIAGLRQCGWELTELLRQYMLATGMIKHFNTLVDFYSHIKGVEYLICIVFFVAFPFFYRYVNEDRKKIKT